MEAGGKDRPPMLAPGNYNPPYKFKWTEMTVLVVEGSSETTIERLKQGKSINVQDLEANLYWNFRKFTSRDGESLESYYSRFYKIMNELQSQELKIVSYHKLYDILKQQQNEVNEIRAERLAPATRNRGKAIINSPSPTYDQEHKMVAEDDALSKEKETDKLMALISLSFKKIYKPTNNNLRTSSNTTRAHQDNTPRINRGTGWCSSLGFTYHKEKMILCTQEEAGIQLSAEQADWRDDTDDEPDDQELEAHYLYMAQLQEVNLDAANNSGPIFDTEPLQEVQNDHDNYNVFANNKEHLEQPESVNVTYLKEHNDINISPNSLEMRNNG
ncbi:hypothetical protein Tco_1176072 [Tanacetum coccineum]